MISAITSQHGVHKARSAFAPTITALGNNQYLAAWVNDKGPGVSWIAFRPKDGQNSYEWGRGGDIPLSSVATMVRPALATFKGKVFMAYTEPPPASPDGAPPPVVRVSQFDGTSWSPGAPVWTPGNDRWSPGQPGSGVTLAPALASLGPVLLVLWCELTASGSDAVPPAGATGLKVQTQIYCSSSADGQRWIPKQQMPDGHAHDTPALVVRNGTGLLAWQGEGSNRIWINTLSPNRGWGKAGYLPDAYQTSASPALGLGGDGIGQLVWKAASDDSLWRATTAPDGTVGQPEQVPRCQTTLQPVLASPIDSKTELLLGWKDASNDDLWVGPIDTMMFGNLGFHMQFQLMANWCWIACATNIIRFYDPQGKWTQCQLATGRLSKYNGLVGTCCPTAEMVKNANLSSRLADPHSPKALGAMDDLLKANPALSPVCNHTGGLGDSLAVAGYPSAFVGNIPPEKIASEIAAGRVVAMSVTFPGHGDHYLSIPGVYKDSILVCDSSGGTSINPLSTFEAKYRGGLKIRSYVLTAPLGSTPG